MRKLLVWIASAVMVLPTVSVADDGPRSRPPGHSQNHGHGPPDWRGGDQYSYRQPRSYPKYRYGHGRVPYYTYYRHARPPYYAPNYYYYGGHRHRHGNDNDDDDDALWAIGGLIVGAVIGTAVERSQSRTAAPPAPSGPPSGCEDTIVYDSSGNPRVQRNCY